MTEAQSAVTPVAAGRRPSGTRLRDGLHSAYWAYACSKTTDAFARASRCGVGGGRTTDLGAQVIAHNVQHAAAGGGSARWRPRRRGGDGGVGGGSGGGGGDTAAPTAAAARRRRGAHAPRPWRRRARVVLVAAPPARLGRRSRRRRRRRRRRSHVSARGGGSVAATGRCAILPSTRAPSSAQTPLTAVAQPAGSAGARSTNARHAHAHKRATRARRAPRCARVACGRPRRRRWTRRSPPSIGVHGRRIRLAPRARSRADNRGADAVAAAARATARRDAEDPPPRPHSHPPAATRRPPFPAQDDLRDPQGGQRAAEPSRATSGHRARRASSRRATVQVLVDEGPARSRTCKYGVGQVITGGIRAAGMTVGEERAADARRTRGYAARAWRKIPPGATLEFTLECLQIK